MKAFLIRLNTLILILFIVGGVGGGCFGVFNALQKDTVHYDFNRTQGNDAKAQEYLNKAMNQMSASYTCHDYSNNTDFASQECFDEAYKTTMGFRKDDFLMAFFMGFLAPVYYALISAVISWLAGAGFCVHFRLKSSP